jgi:hypothetical protein
MKSRLSVAAIPMLLIAGQICIRAGETDAADQQITVVLCDKARLSPAQRAQARAQATRILKTSNIGVEWKESCDTVEKPSYLSLVIAPRQTDVIDRRPDSMGLAVVIREPYRRAYVFFDLVREFDARHSVRSSPETQAVILGHAMAHELGHLLGHKHALSGIMMRQWGPRERSDAMAGTLRFAELSAASR